MTPRPGLLPSIAVVLAGCASPNDDGAVRGPFVGPAQAGVDARGAGESDDVGGSATGRAGATLDGDADLDGIERLADAGDLGAARTRLRAWLEPGLERRTAELPPPRADARLERLVEIALACRDATSEQAVREALHAHRETHLPPDDPERLEAAVNLATAIVDRGGAERARALLEEAEAAWAPTLAPEDARRVGLRASLATALRILGEFGRARAIAEDVLAVRARALPAYDPAVLRAEQELAATLHAMGELHAALALEERVHRVQAGRLPDGHPDLLLAKENLAVTRGALGDPAGARELLEVVLAERERTLPADHPARWRATRNLATARFELGDLEGSRALLEGLHADLDGLLDEGHRERLLTRQNLAVARAVSGDLDGARALEEENLAVLERALPAEHPDVLTQKQNLAVTCKESGDFGRALELERDVLAARERLLPADHPDLLDARQNLLATLLVTGDLAQARAASVALLEAQVAAAEGLGRLSSRGARAAAFDELDRLSRLLSVSETLEAFGEAPLDVPLLRTLETLRLASTRSAALARAAHASPDVRRALRELAAARERTAAVVHRAPADPASVGEWRATCFELAGERDRLERELGRRLGPASRAPALDDLAARLGPDEALAAYLRYPRIEGVGPGGGSPRETDSMLAFVLGPDGRVQRVELGPAGPIAGRVREWRAAIGRPVRARSRGEPVVVQSAADARDADRAGEELRRLVLDPVLERAAGARVLHAVLDDVLHLVPLDALPLEDGVVGDRVEIRSLPTVAPLLDRRTPDAPSRLLALGGIDYAATPEAPARPVIASGVPSGLRGAPFEALPETDAELETVAGLFEGAFERPATVLRGAAATKDRFTALAPEARFLHVATHGWFVSAEDAASLRDDAGVPTHVDERARETLERFLPETLCGVALAGASRGPDADGRLPGILTAEELAALDLSRCELAVLSACETNVGLRRAGQGVRSLQTALHAAGVRTAVTSLWKVEDAATRRLFERFYAALWRDGLRPGEALRQARSSLRADGHPPRDWAAWIVTGAAD